MHKPHTLVHFDVCGPDLAALAPFYEALFGWRVNPRGPGYAQVATPDGCPDGALVEAPESRLTVGILVPDLEATVAAAAASGGTVEMPPMNNGWVKKAMVRDPAGNLLTLIEGKGGHDH